MTRLTTVLKIEIFFLQRSFKICYTIPLAVLLTTKIQEISNSNSDIQSPIKRWKIIASDLRKFYAAFKILRSFT